MGIHANLMEAYANLVEAYANLAGAYANLAEAYENPVWARAPIYVALSICHHTFVEG